MDVALVRFLRLKPHAPTCLLLCTALSAFACGEAQKVEQAITTWTDEGPMKQRYDKCSEEQGDWVAKITVDACTQGTAQLHVQVDPNDTTATTQAQECKQGTGGEYTYQCAHYDNDHRLYFSDGPSTPNIAQAASGFFGDSANQLNWNDIFWDAARNHDYCYHNGVTRNLTKDDCDHEFYADMQHVCADPSMTQYSWFSLSSCHLQADGMFEAVQSQGEAYYNIMATVVDYPVWQAPPQSLL